LLDDGQAELGTRACKSLLNLLDQQEKKMDSLTMDVTQAGILFAIEAGNSATVFKIAFRKCVKRQSRLCPLPF